MEQTKRAVELPGLQGEWTGEAKFYRLTPPIKETRYSWSEDEPDEVIEHDYVIVSATVVMFSGPETYIFPANEDGSVKSWGELEGSFRGGLNHEEALTNAGYQVVSKVAQ